MELEALTDYKQALVGVVGSHAYGLSTPQSDVDLRGVFIAPTKVILGIFSVPDTIDRNEPDICLYEISKFVRLALAANPNILEMFYLLEYKTLTAEGKLLIDNREAFLSSRVRDSYCGYAMSQIKKVQRYDSKHKAMQHLSIDESAQRIWEEQKISGFVGENLQTVSESTTEETLLEKARILSSETEYAIKEETKKDRRIGSDIQEMVSPENNLWSESRDVRTNQPNSKSQVQNMSGESSTSSRSQSKTGIHPRTTMSQMQFGAGTLQGPDLKSSESYRIFRTRRGKFIRHCFRLIQQGNELLTTGNLTVKVADPEKLFWIGEQSPEKLEKLFLQEFNKIKSVASVLPKEPDMSKVNEVLLTIRSNNP